MLIEQFNWCLEINLEKIASWIVLWANWIPEKLLVDTDQLDNGDVQIVSCAYTMWI